MKKILLLAISGILHLAVFSQTCPSLCPGGDFNSGNSTLNTGQTGFYIACSSGDPGSYTWRVSDGLEIANPSNTAAVQVRAKCPNPNGWVEYSFTKQNSFGFTETCTARKAVTVSCSGITPRPAWVAAHYDDCVIHLQIAPVPCATYYEISIDGDPRYGTVRTNLQIMIGHAFVQFASEGDHNICVRAYGPCGWSSQKCTFYTVPYGNGPYDGCGFPNPPLIEKTSSEAEAMESLTIAPNPVFDRLSFLLPAGEQADLTQIFDLQGQMVLQQQGANRQLEVGSLAKGIYFLQVSTREGTIHRSKFMKQ